MLLDVATCCYLCRLLENESRTIAPSTFTGTWDRGTAVAQLRVLEAFGVSPVAEMVYLAMLEHPADRVSTLAEQVGVSEAVVKESLDELAMIALLKPSAEDPGVLRPVAPEI